MTDLTATPVLVAETWDEQKEKLKVKFSNLTDEDLNYEEGKRDEMLDRVGTKIGKTQEELAVIIAGLWSPQSKLLRGLYISGGSFFTD